MNFERISTELRSEQFVFFGPSPTEPFNQGLVRLRDRELRPLDRGGLLRPRVRRGDLRELLVQPSQCEPPRRVGAHLLRCAQADGAAHGRGERPARPSGAASEKRPHSRRRRLSAELQNVGEASGKPRGSSDLFELFRKMLHFFLFFCCILKKKLEKCWLILGKIQQSSGKIF